MGNTSKIENEKIIKKGFKENSGITLIALVITIIVLLILAGVTIATLTGDNGMLQKATSANQANEIATAQEKIQVEVAGSYGLDGKIDIEQLNSNLKRVNGLKYNDKDIILEGDNKNSIEELPTEVRLENINFFIDKNGNVLNWKIADIINKKIGEVVQGYSAANLQWQVFYSDPIETYLISKTKAKSNFSIPLKRDKQSENEEEYKYKGSEDVRKSIYGTKWNKMWLDKCINNESFYSNAKATAYMCDPENWKEYNIGIANYAVGGPTLELFIESWNKSQGTNIKILDNEVGRMGISSSKPTELRDSEPIKNEICNGVYNQGYHYWIASPGDNNENYMRYLKNVGRINGYSYSYNYNIRPIVSIPTSKITVNGDTVTVNP